MLGLTCDMWWCLSEATLGLQILELHYSTINPTVPAVPSTVPLPSVRPITIVECIISAVRYLSTFSLYSYLLACLYTYHRLAIAHPDTACG